MSECDCPLEGDSYQEEMLDPCNDESPEGAYLCSKPEGHDGPHAACNVMEHPAKVWDGEEVEA